MLKIVLCGLAVVLVVFGIVVALQPAGFTVKRSVTIAAPPSRLFVYANSLHQWNTWSPWAKMDPDSRITYEGPLEGKDAAFQWESRKTGAGRMTIVESVPDERVTCRLDFKKPFEATHQATFEFEPEGNDTRVTWTMTGRNNFFFKAMGLFMNCDRMIGAEFEKGLADLKTIVESRNSRVSVP